MTSIADMSRRDRNRRRHKSRHYAKRDRSWVEGNARRRKAAREGQDIGHFRRREDGVWEDDYVYPLD